MLITKNKLEGLTCPKTNSKLDAYQQVTIDQLPYVLLLHLKCFEYKEQKLTKIMKNVEFSVNLEIKSSKYIFICLVLQTSIKLKSLVILSDLFLKFRYVIFFSRAAF